MARTVAQILSQIKAQKNAEPSLSGLNSPSNVAVYNLWMYITAVSIALFEQVLDIYQAFIETLIGKAGVGTLPWMRDRILAFQSGYNVTYSNGSMSYSVIDTEAQIITRCSVTQGANKTVNIKTAKGEPPEALSSGELQELQFYGSKISFAGTQLNITTGDADMLYVLADIYFDGQLSETEIKSNVVAAMEAYCKSLSTVENFDGSIIIPAIEVALLNATGVKYIKIYEIASRPASSVFASRTILYSLSSGIDIPKSSTVSGYLIGETDTGHTFDDSFTYIPAT
jgi:hypothetical protein